jgi:outer membrane protein
VKTVSLVLNAVLLVAVAVLFFLHFKGTPSGGASSSVDSTGQAGMQNVAIAYVNSDSLLKKYDYFKDLEKQFNEKRDKLDAEYRNRAQGLQTEISNYQQNVGNMTISQAKAVEEDLQRKQQNLMVYQESLTRQLVEEEGKMNEQLYDKVSEYLKEYGAKHDLQLVLTYTKGSGVLYANKAMNITHRVIEGLNEAYVREKSGAKSATQASGTDTGN